MTDAWPLWALFFTGSLVAIYVAKLLDDRERGER